MWNPPVPEDFRNIPTLYSTDDIGLHDKVIHIHFFLGGSDWYGAEYDPKDRLFFGYAILNDDLHNSEWGYFSLDELQDIRIGPFEIDRDIHWKPVPVREIPKIMEAYRLKGWKEEKDG